MSRAERDGLAAHVKRDLDVVQLAAELGHGKVRGGNAHCPNRSAHGSGDGKPSMQVFSDGVHCYGGACGFSADAVGLVELTQGMDYIEALAFCVERTPGAMPHDSVSNSKPTIVYTPRQEVPRRTAKQSADERAARLDVMRRIWTIVKPLPLTASASRWLQRERGITPSTAHALGCRDWFPARAEIWEYLATLELDQLRAAGFNKQNDTEGEPDLQWSPLRRLAEPRVHGLAVPCWMPGDDVPIAWRWRYFNPSAAAGRGTPLKCRAQYGPPFPIGLAVPENALFIEGASTSPTVLITEGEPDWLSAHDCLLAGVGVVGITSTSTVDHGHGLVGWLAEWTQHIAHAERVVVMVHEGVGTLQRRPETSTGWANGMPAGKAIARSIFVELARAHGEAEARARLLLMLMPDKPNKVDCNDLHKANRLRPFLVSRGIASLSSIAV